MNKTISDTTQLAEDLRSAVGRFVRAVRTQSASTTTVQSEVLADLERTGPATVTELAALRDVKHQSMRLVVARLVVRGLLEMQANPDDGRSQMVTLTSSGRAKLAAQQAARTEHLTRLLTLRLSTAERDVIAQAAHLLDKLSNID